MKASTIAVVSGLAVVAIAAFVVGRQAPSRKPARPAPPARRAQPTPPVAQSYQDAGLRVTVEKPKSRDWAMADHREQFHDPGRHPAKVVEIRREPRGGDDRFAIIELYVLDIPQGADPAAEVQKIERLGPRGKIGRFRVVEEGPVTIGGHSMTRRVTEWDARGTRVARENPLAAEGRLVSVRTVVDGKLYLVLSAMPSRYYESLLPEIEQTFRSLRIG